MEHKPIPATKVVPWFYDTTLWILSVLVDLFFREVHPRGAFKIPTRGPVIFVAAPHANQFVDSLILMRQVRLESGRRISFLVAEKSMRLKFIGNLARAMGSISVARAQDMTRTGTGKIKYQQAENALVITGIGTKFKSEVPAKGMILLPNSSAEVDEIYSDTELRLRREFKGAHVADLLSKVEGVAFKTAPKVDQSLVYDDVFGRLNDGGTIGIFPEGGSHDRTELLPLKAGVAVMALGAVAANPECNVRIVPCGMNYFHAHKFRSRAVIEFGSPLEVPKELVDMYMHGDKREAVRLLLENIYNALLSVTVSSKDYDTLMVIQAVRRLYRQGKNKKMPLPVVVELNRRLINGYNAFKDHPDVIHLREAVTKYNRDLRLLGLRDHQVAYARFTPLQVFATLVYRCVKLTVLFWAALPGAVLFAPVFIASKSISRRKAKQALKASTVKVQARDVLATWKLLVALGLAPVLYWFYALSATYWVYTHDALPSGLPIWVVPAIMMVIFPMITFSALRIGEVGMDIFKSLRPLLLSLNPTSVNTLHKLRTTREDLSFEVTELISKLGPELYPDFDHTRVITDPYKIGLRRRDSDGSETSSPGNGLSESFGNLGSVALFAGRLSSAHRSRSSSSIAKTTGVKKISSLDTEGGAEEVSRRIRTAMGQRRMEHRRRRSASTSGNVSGEGSGYTTESEERRKLD